MLLASVTKCMLYLTGVNPFFVEIIGSKVAKLTCLFQAKVYLIPKPQTQFGWCGTELDKVDLLSQ